MAEEEVAPDRTEQVMKGTAPLNRFIDHGDCLCAYSDPILIECPRCGHSGSLALPAAWASSRKWNEQRTFACLHCAYAFSWKPKATIHSLNDWNKRLPLLLQTKCCGHVLWAFNGDHLRYVETYVSAGLRERIDSKNNSLASRLPQWIKSAKNRGTILSAVKRLRKRFEKIAPEFA